MADRLTEGGMLVTVRSARLGTEETLARLGTFELDAKVLNRDLSPFGVVPRRRAALLAARG